MKKRIVSALLAVAMVLAMVSFAAAAVEPEYVYMSVSFDGEYIPDKNGAALCYLAVPMEELAKIDLSEYGLEQYVYDADYDGNYEITALHADVYVHTVICGRDWSEVAVSGSAGSIFFERGIFGFSDCNLIYYHNGEYPNVGGWGTTADQIVLSDGDYLDVSGFSSWGFYSDSGAGFRYFVDESDNIVHQYTVTAGNALTVNLARVPANLYGGVSLEKIRETDCQVFYGTSMESADGSVYTDSSGSAQITFSKAGTYRVWSNGCYGIDMDTMSIVSAPAFANITVTAPTPDPADPIDVHVSIANKGEVVMANDKITVTDRDASGNFTVDEVLYAAHEGAYTGGAAAGYGSAMGDYGLYITKLWGNTSGNYGYWLNDVSCLSLADTVKDGDSLVAFVYQNTEVWDSYSKFAQDSYTTMAEAATTVTLEKAGYDASWNTVFAAHKGATLKVYDGQLKEISSSDYKFVDNGDGTYSVTVKNIGEYTVVAYDNATPTVPALCTLTVTQNPDLVYADGVEVKIEAIGTVTLESETAIGEARTAYNALTDAQKALVSNYSTLTAAENTLAQLKEEAAQEAADQAAADAVEQKIAEIGTVTVFSGNKITAARTDYEALTDAQKALVENTAVLTAAEKTIQELYVQAASSDPKAIFDATASYLSGLGTPGVGSTGGEWMVIDMTRAGQSCPEGYYKNVEDYVKAKINDKEQLHRAKGTDNSRVIVALTSAGYDVTNVAGHNLLMGLTDMSYVKKQGINGPIWALIAFDTHNYSIPANPNAADQVTREKLINYILEKRLSDGGWALSGKVSDPDITGMAIQALAPYYKTNAQVRTAVDEALACMSQKQHANGGFGSVDGVCAESCAQIIVALTALGLDPETDSRFVKNGVSVLDAMCLFAKEGGGFAHIPGGSLNGMATEQSQYALAAYFRFKNGQTALYDMTDVALPGEKVAAQIKAIGTVSVDSEKAITEARSAYDALSDYQKSLVANYAELTAAEKTLAEQKAAAEKQAADKAAADAVMAKIDAIGTVTKASEKVVTEARSAYDALSDYQKTLVSNYSGLTNAEAKLKQLKDQGKVENTTDEKENAHTGTLDVSSGEQAATPYTGDHTNVMLLAALMLVSLCGICILLVSKKRMYR